MTMTTMMTTGTTMLNVDHLKHWLKLLKLEFYELINSAEKGLDNLVDGASSFNWQRERGRVNATEAYAYVKGKVEGLKQGLESTETLIEKFFGTESRVAEEWTHSALFEWHKTLVAVPVPPLAPTIKIDFPSRWLPTDIQFAPPKEHEHL